MSDELQAVHRTLNWLMVLGVGNAVFSLMLLAYCLWLEWGVRISLGWLKDLSKKG